MKLEVFAIYDVKISAFMRPFFQHSRGEAVRSFTEMVDGKNCPFNARKNGADYVLFHIGSWDDCKGAFTDLVAPEPLGSALDWMTKDPVLPPSDLQRIAELTARVQHLEEQLSAQRSV